MKDSKTGTAALLLIALVGGALLIKLWPEISPLASLDLRYSRGEIMRIAVDRLEHMGYDVEKYYQDATLQFDDPIDIYLQSKRGMAGANHAIRDGEYPAHTWDVRWYDRSVPRSENAETFSAWLTPAGKLVGFDHVIKDSVARPSLSDAEARSRAEEFLRAEGVDLSTYRLKRSSENAQVNRVDHRFVWERKDSLGTFTVWARVQGTEVGGYHATFVPPPEFLREFTKIATTWTFVSTAAIAGTFLLLFFIVILFLKKYHEGEVGIETGIMIFLGLFTVNLLRTLNELPALGTTLQIGDMNQFNVRIVAFVIEVLIIQVFIGVMAFAAWSVGESSSRSAWPEKMRAMDAALSRHFFTAEIGRGILRGYLWGLAILGLNAFAFWLYEQVKGSYLYTGTLNGVPEAYVPAVQPILLGIVFAVEGEVINRFFFLSYMKEKTGRRWPGILVSSAVWAATAQTIWELPFGLPGPFASYAVLFLFGLAFSFLFLRYDLITAISASFLVISVHAASPIFAASGGSLAHLHWVTVALLAVPVVIGIIGLLRRQTFEFTVETTPKHIRRITERERMARELEIARNVQLSLLPKANPRLDGYDIAGVCLPALEVGGDYFDFVDLGPERIGIAIGDVSGKGVPAAIYMTLTKGILQSYAEETASPRAVLSKVNTLMYRTIERNSFVSMFYAVLDLGNARIRFARAGQCPLIMTQQAGGPGSLLTPRGMALGLEMGKVFDSVLEEQEIALRHGEVLAFYTDGFTEAMNSRGEEYGEDRLMAAVSAHRDETAEGLIRNVVEDLRGHAGDAPQHDDMTMVVVKVL